MAPWVMLSTQVVSIVLGLLGNTIVWIVAEAYVLGNV